MGKFTFRKAERLSKEKDIKELFDKGSSFYLFPFKILAMPGEAETFHEILISVSRRNFKKAVDRNRIKRRIREAYRLNKHLLPPAPAWRIGFVYTHKELLAGRELSAKMVHAIRRISSLPAPRPKSF